MSGKFITFEGGEGAGKSTQIRRLAGALEASGREVILTREPGGTAGGEAIRSLLVEGAGDRWSPLSEALLNYAARLEHVEQVIKPALEAGKWVISDRFADSTLAYQGRGQGLWPEKIRALHRLALGTFSADLTLILDIDVEMGLARAHGRQTVMAREGDAAAQEDRFERMELEFHERIRNAFLEVAKAEPERCAVFDAALDEETLAQKIQAVVASRLDVSFAAGLAS